MKSNEDVIKAFLNGEEVENKYVSSTYEKLMYGNTCIAERIDAGILVNNTIYNAFISAVQNRLLFECCEHNYNHLRIYDIPYETKSLKTYIK